MATATATTIANRYDFVYLFDVKDGNPNGDPDMANTPRFDPETFQGIVSDVCLKRKIRDYVQAAKGDTSGCRIFVQQGNSLENHQKEPYDKLKIPPKTKDQTEIARAREFMCENFFDVRAFGAVMSTTDFNCGQVRGPVQVTFARSIDRIFHTEHGITRVAYTKEEKRQSTSAQTEMGNKHTVAYGLYVAHGFVSPHLADGNAGTGFTQDDLELLWQALGNMFDLDRSAARGLMACRGLYVFEHDSKLGNAPAHLLFERVKAEKNPDVETPRAFADYTVTVDGEAMDLGASREVLSGVRVTRKW